MQKKLETDLRKVYEHHASIFCTWGDRLINHAAMLGYYRHTLISRCNIVIEAGITVRHEHWQRQSHSIMDRSIENNRRTKENSLTLSELMSCHFHRTTRKDIPGNSRWELSFKVIDRRYTCIRLMATKVARYLHTIAVKYGDLGHWWHVQGGPQKVSHYH